MPVQCTITTAHPLLRNMYEVYPESRCVLKSLFIRYTFQHVATYVIVNSKGTLLCNVRKKTAKKREVEVVVCGATPWRKIVASLTAEERRTNTLRGRLERSRLLRKVDEGLPQQGQAQLHGQAQEQLALQDHQDNM